MEHKYIFLVKYHRSDSYDLFYDSALDQAIAKMNNNAFYNVENELLRIKSDVFPWQIIRPDSEKFPIAAKHFDERNKT